MDVVVTIAAFKNLLRSRGYAEGTIRSYRENLDRFTQYLKDRHITDLRKVTHQTILDYQESIMAQPVGIETKAIRMRAVKRLFEYLESSHRLLINPTEGIIETSRKNRKIGPILTVEEIKRLFAQPNLSLKPHIRDRAIMELLYSTGIRLDEMLGVEIYHVDFREKVLFVHKGKGKKQRMVPMGKSAVKYLKEYLEKIRPYYAKKNPKERKVFLLNTGQAMTSGSVRFMFYTHRTRAGIKKPVSPHTIRRSCATHMMQQGADIRYIQKLLGHKSLKTTQSYIKVMAVDVKKTHDAMHPGVKDENED